MLEQDLSNVDFGEEFIVPAAWKRYMVPITDIESALRGWATLAWFKGFDQINADESVAISDALNL